MVVPVYDVEDYLAACLDSLAAQTVGPLEVVVVDDGSTDGSAEIAEAYVARHRTWKLIRTENHGLGAARNRGVAEATREFLAFADSDDLIPEDAYATLVDSLEESGSDFAVGSIQQLVRGRLVEPEFLREVMALRRTGVRATDIPAITRNVFAWTKVFRRSFYDRAGIRFPEGVRYEDQPAMMRAYLLADRFDIIRRPVYTWRIRAEGTSITQGRAQLADLEDRFATKELTAAVVRDHGDAVVQDFWGRLGAVGDLPVYFEQIPFVDEAWWRRLVTGLRELLADGPPIEESRLRLPQRLVGWLVVQDRRADAEELLAWIAAHEGPLRLTVEGDRVVAPDLPFSSDPAYDLPDALRHLGPHELVFDARLLAARWDESVLVLTGWALVRGAPTAGVDTDVRVGLSPDDEREVRPAIVTRFSAPEATRWINRDEQVYDDSGFVARIDLADWLAEACRGSAGAGRLAGGGRRLGAPGRAVAQPGGRDRPGPSAGPRGRDPVVAARDRPRGGAALIRYGVGSARRTTGGSSEGTARGRWHRRRPGSARSCPTRRCTPPSSSWSGRSASAPS